MDVMHDITKHKFLLSASLEICYFNFHCTSIFDIPLQDLMALLLVLLLNTGMFDNEQAGMTTCIRNITVIKFT